jgi:PAS domain S-box-containing protein
MNSILVNLPNSVYWKDINGVYLGANLHAIKMVGLNSLEDIIGKTDYDFNPQDKADKFRENDLIVIKTAKTITVEETTRTPNGTILYQLSTKKPLRNNDGVIIGVIGITIDITKRRNHELLLFEKTTSLQNALLENKRFLNNISHEIKTPLNIINTISTELHDNYINFSPKQITHCLSILKLQSKTLITLVNDLLDLAKTQKNRYTYKLKKTNIVIIIEDVISDFSNLAKISLQASKRYIYAKIDCLKIIQVIRNIIDNAIKYSHNSPINIIIQDFDGILITIQNHSIGIPRGEELKVFEPFFQGSNNLSKAGGTGLGLAICQDIIHAHKGSIKIETDDSSMTSVRIKLPQYK